MRKGWGAVVVLGMICLGRATGEWLLRVHAPGEAVSFSGVPADSLPGSPENSFSAAPENHSRAAGPRGARPRDALSAPLLHGDLLRFLSTAPADSLDLLPGVGPVLAGRIVAAREAHGPFASWSDVRAVKGIGPRIIARWQAVTAGK